MTYLPEVYHEFMRRFPEISEAYDDLADRCHTWGPVSYTHLTLPTN